MVKSTMMGIIGRMAAYTGKALTWEQAMASTEDLSPASVRLGQDRHAEAVAKPGLTKFM